MSFIYFTLCVSSKIYLGFEIGAQATVVVFFIFLGRWAGQFFETRYQWSAAEDLGTILGVFLGLLESLLWFLKRIKKL